MLKKTSKEYIIITLSSLLVAFGTYFFKFPNNFSFGGVTGLAVIIGKISPLTPSTVNLILNVILLVIGFIFIGKDFGIKTVYSSIILSFGISLMELLFPLSAPLTDEPFLELIFAIIIPAIGSAILFNIGASSGGTDIIAMILKKKSNINLGRALLFSDVLITFSSFFVFDIKTVLFSVLGLFSKALVVDQVIENINRCKYFNVVCSNPEPICEFIVSSLKRSATICEAQGAFSHEKKYIIFTALKSYQAVMLRQYIKNQEPSAFILITNTSEIIGKGFHGI